MVLATTPARVCGSAGATYLTGVQLTRADGSPNGQFYKWQLVSALISTGTRRPGPTPVAGSSCAIE